MCKSIIGIDANQFYPFYIGQDVPTSLYTRWDYKEQLQGESKSRSKVWKYGHVIFLSNQTSSQNWELLHYRNTIKNWLLQCWWLLQSMSDRLCSNGLFFPFLPSSRSLTKPNWWWYKSGSTKNTCIAWFVVKNYQHNLELIEQSRKKTLFQFWQRPNFGKQNRSCLGPRTVPCQVYHSTKSIILPNIITIWFTTT